MTQTTENNWSVLPQDKDTFSPFFYYEDNETLAGYANCDGVQGWGIAVQENRGYFGIFRNSKLIVDVTPIAEWVFESFILTQNKDNSFEVSLLHLPNLGIMFGVNLPSGKFVGFSVSYEGVIATHLIDNKNDEDLQTVFFPDGSIKFIEAGLKKAEKELSQQDFYMLCGARPDFLAVEVDNLVFPQDLPYDVPCKLKLNNGRLLYDSQLCAYKIEEHQMMNVNNIPYHYVLTTRRTNINRLFNSSRFALPKLCFNPRKILAPTYEDRITREYNTKLNNFYIKIIDARHIGGKINDIALVHKSVTEEVFKKYVEIGKVNKLFDLTAIMLILVSVLLLFFFFVRFIIGVDSPSELHIFRTKFSLVNSSLLYFIWAIGLFQMNRYRVLGYLAITSGCMIYGFFTQPNILQQIIVSLTLIIPFFVLLFLKDNNGLSGWQKFFSNKIPLHRDKPVI